MRVMGYRAALAAVALAGVMGSAQAQDLSDLKGWLGVGVSTDAINFGSGPTAEYWFTPRIAGSATLGLVGSFTSYGARAVYLFDGPYELLGETFRPYVAGGYSQIKGSSNFEGSGFELVGGLQQMGFLGKPNLGWGAEFQYSTVKLEARYCDPWGCSTVSGGDYSSFGFAGKLLYYFRPGF